MKTVLIILAAVLLSAATVFLVLITKIPFILIVTCAVLYGAYFLITNQSVEYEYAVTNDEMDVDKIIAKRKRVHLITVSTKTFEAFGPVSEDLAEDDNRTLVLCSDNTERANIMPTCPQKLMDRHVLSLHPMPLCWKP